MRISDWSSDVCSSDLVMPKEERDLPWLEKLALLRAGLLPLFIFFSMTGLFLLGYTNLTESSAVGALASTLAAAYKRRLTVKVIAENLRKTIGISCLLMWIILDAICFGAGFVGLGRGNTHP